RVDQRVGAAALEVAAVPRRPLGARVLRIAGLERLALERLRGRVGGEDELDHLPVAFVLVVPVVVDVVEPVLEREPVRPVRLGGDVRVDRRRLPLGDLLEPALVRAARLQRIPGEIEEVLRVLAVDVAHRRRLQGVAVGAAQGHVVAAEHQVDGDGLVRLAVRVTFPRLLLQDDDRRVALREPRCGRGRRGGRRREQREHARCGRERNDEGARAAGAAGQDFQRWTRTAGRSPTSSFEIRSVTLSDSTFATAPIGIVTSRRPQRWPRSSTKWVISSPSTTRASTVPRCWSSFETTALERRISASPLGTRSYVIMYGSSNDGYTPTSGVV